MELGSNKKKRRLAHFLMICLVMMWGLDYIFAKYALAVFPSLTLVFFKYGIGIFIVLLIKLRRDRSSIIRKKDIPLLVLCAITGEILYFFCEYEAMSHIPVALVTIVLAFVPAVSIIIERILYKKNPTKLMVGCIFLCIAGIGLVIGADFKALFQGRIIGYLLSFGAVLSWNCYNFITASLSEKYTGITLTLNQLLCTIILLSPYALTHLPSVDLITPKVVIGVIYLGMFSAGIGFYVYVYSLKILGPTTNSVYSNFLPVTTTLFGFLFLGEEVSILQLVGGIIVISAGYLVIKEKGKLEENFDG